MIRVIDRFVGDHSFLNNFHPCAVRIGGITYKSAEAAYQAQKFEKLEDKIKISQMVSPLEAKRCGKTAVLCPLWASRRVSTMLEVVTAKFDDPMLQCQLVGLLSDDGLRHGERNVSFVNENRYNDRFWGTVNGEGENNLGIILNSTLDDIIARDPNLLEMVLHDREKTVQSRFRPW